MENLMIALHKNNLLKNSNIRISNIGWEIGTIKLIKWGETIYKEGDISKSIYLIVKGSVLLTLNDNHGNSQSVIFSNNDFFGAKELFSKINRCCETISLAESFIVELTLPEIEYLVRKDDNIALNIQKGNFDFKYDQQTKKNFTKKYFNGFSLENIQLN